MNSFKRYHAGRQADTWMDTSWIYTNTMSQCQPLISGCGGKGGAGTRHNINLSFLTGGGGALDLHQIQCHNVNPSFLAVGGECGGGGGWGWGEGT